MTCPLTVIFDASVTACVQGGGCTTTLGNYRICTVDGDCLTGERCDWAAIGKVSLGICQH